MDAILDAVDFSSAATWVGTMGAVIVTIALGLKGISLAKRGVAKA